MTAFEIDSTELRALADDLRKAGRNVAAAVNPPIQRGMLNVKRQLTAEMAASEHFKGAAGSMSYEVAPYAGGIEGKGGPDKDRPGGALANIAYFGTSRGGGTVPDPGRALEVEAPKFEEAVANALRALL